MLRRFMAARDSVLLGHFATLHSHAKPHIILTLFKIYEEYG
jgi:hypothetical protein